MFTITCMGLYLSVGWVVLVLCYTFNFDNGKFVPLPVVLGWPMVFIYLFVVGMDKLAKYIANNIHIG